MKDVPIMPTCDQLTPAVPWATSEKPRVAPTMLWVADTGILRMEATIIHIHDPATGNSTSTLYIVPVIKK